MDSRGEVIFIDVGILERAIVLGYLFLEKGGIIGIIFSKTCRTMGTFEETFRNMCEI